MATIFGGRDEISIERRTSTRIDHLEDVVTTHIREDLIPRVSEHHRISVATDPVDFLYFSRIKFGRVCTCWTEVESEQDFDCPVCYGVGIPTGYKKYGCVWDCLDCSTTCNTVNVAPDFDAQTRPQSFTLINNAVRGWIDWTVQIQPNIGLIDMMKLGAYQPVGTRITLYVRKSTESTFTEVVGKDAVESRLLDSSGLPTTLVFRILMGRSPKGKNPKVTFFHVRYRTRTEITVPVDIPKDSQSITLGDMGLYDSWQTLQMVFGTKLRDLGVKDFFVRVRDATRWKLTTLEPFKPAGHLVGYDGTSRLVQPYEPYTKVP